MSDPLEGIKWRSLGGKRITHEMLVEDGPVPELEEDDGLEILKLNQDIYSFMLCYKFYTCHFWTATRVVVGVHMVMPCLLLFNSIDFHDQKNPFQVSGNIDVSVRCTQIVALLVAIFD